MLDFLAAWVIIQTMEIKLILWRIFATSLIFEGLFFPTAATSQLSGWKYAPLLAILSGVVLWSRSVRRVVKRHISAP